MTFTSSALESEKPNSEFGIQGRGNWKSETGSPDGQFPTPDFRPPESWLVNLDSRILMVLLFGLFGFLDLDSRISTPH
jgi:hypothetical protein